MIVVSSLLRSRIARTFSCITTPGGADVPVMRCSWFARVGRSKAKSGSAGEPRGKTRDEVARLPSGPSAPEPLIQQKAKGALKKKPLAEVILKIAPVAAPLRLRPRVGLHLHTRKYNSAALRPLACRKRLPVRLEQALAWTNE